MELNKVYNEPCLETLRKMPDNFVDCIVTSPPYNKSFWSMNQNPNNGFKTKSRKITYGDFDDNLDPAEYERQQKEVIAECLRVLKDTGSLFYNHIDILHKHMTIHPKFVYDFPVKQVIVWNRKNTPKIDVSYFYPTTEYIFWIKKHADSIPKFDRKKAQFQKSVWEINPETDNDHPAPFPMILASNCIVATTDENDLVYDPYMGSGTTAMACIEYKRNFIGSELNQDYIDMSHKRFEPLLKQTKLF
jgi:site-specific DNA-methyltransferase (adenine-specific)